LNRPGGKHPIIFEPGFRAPDGTVAEIVGVGHYKKKNREGNFYLISRECDWVHHLTQKAPLVAPLLEDQSGRSGIGCRRRGSDVMDELSLRICGAVQTHLPNFLCEERGDSFADSDPYCRWRSVLIIEVMQLD
jgi:hypothetical protein